MTETENERLSELLAAAVEDWTPGAASGAARVLFLAFLKGSEVLDQCRAVLSDAELARSVQFIREGDQAHFLQRRAFRRYCGALASGSSRPLSAIEFDETDNGRPYLSQRPDLWFSFSGCRVGFLGAWSLTHAIGVDLEDLAREVEAVELAVRFFTSAEYRAVANASIPSHTFLQLWSLKEAALKSIGEGLPYGLDAFEFELTPALRLVSGPAEQGGADAFFPHLTDRPNICAAMVIRDR
jgi:4'-phosphopantetheinyl transferase